jgi:hypothetical protein
MVGGKSNRSRNGNFPRVSSVTQSCWVRFLHSLTRVKPGAGETQLVLPGLGAGVDVDST